MCRLDIYLLNPCQLTEIFKHGFRLAGSCDASKLETMLEKFLLTNNGFNFDISLYSKHPLQNYVSEFYRTIMEYGISHELNIVFCCALFWNGQKTYRKTSNIRHTLIGNKIVDHSDVVGASPVGAAPTTSSFSFRLNIWLQGLRQRQPQDSTRIF